MKKYLLLLTLLITSTSFALENPSSRAILTVTGLITNTNNADAALFDLAMLDQLPRQTTTTHTPWTEGRHTYTGFSAEEFFQLLNIQGNTLLVSALNDYTIEIPVDDFLIHGAIFATHMDGVPMSIRNKGPIMVIYPFDEKPQLKIETYFARSIWQIKNISVK